MVTPTDSKCANEVAESGYSRSDRTLCPPCMDAARKANQKRRPRRAEACDRARGVLNAAFVCVVLCFAFVSGRSVLHELGGQLAHVSPLPSHNRFTSLPYDSPPQPPNTTPPPLPSASAAMPLSPCPPPPPSPSPPPPRFNVRLLSLLSPRPPPQSTASPLPPPSPIPPPQPSASPPPPRSPSLPPPSSPSPSPACRRQAPAAGSS